MADRGSKNDDGAAAGSHADDRLRLITERAVLQLSGELGYSNVTVAAVLEASGSNRSVFYSTFGSKLGCYLAAYERAAERLTTRLLGACEEAADWRSGMRLALLELAGFTAEDRDLAAGLLVEVHAADDAAAVKRSELFERLSGAIDRARRETGASGSSPPPIASRFVLNAIEAAVIRALREGRMLDQDLPGLLYIAVASYFGSAAASREVRMLDSRCHAD